jgi:magnesium transporter
VPPTVTVREVIQTIKKETADFRFFATVYVVNDKKQLIGVFNPHDLLMQEPDTPVFRFMVQNLIEVRANTPIEIVISKMLKYHLPCLPVVDGEKRMIGMVTFDSVADIIEKKCLN